MNRRSSMDTRERRAYAVGMYRIAVVSLLFAPLLFLAGAFNTAQADDVPVLLVLEYFEIENPAAEKPVAIKIEAKPGKPAPALRGKLADKLRVHPGQKFSGDAAPRERVVDLYHGADIGPTLLCSIKLRYFRNAEGKWVPHFRIEQQPTFLPSPDGRWRMVPSPIALFDLHSANADGFSPTLAFGLSGGKIQLHSWVVH